MRLELKNTRHAILEILKREGPQEAGTLSKMLDITPMAICLQLNALEAEKVVVTESKNTSVLPQKSTLNPRRGRPVRLWKLTEAANRAFPDAHALLTVGLLNSLQEVYGKKGIEKLMQARTRQGVEDYSKSLSLEMSLGDKVKALSLIRDREGYMTEIKAAPLGGYLFIENHCPISTAAKNCPGICQSEWQVFQQLMGSEAKVSREQHLLAGNRKCVYWIRDI